MKNQQLNKSRHVWNVVIASLLSILLLNMFVYTSMGQKIDPTTSKPSITITSPSHCMVGMKPGKLVIEGTANSTLGLKKVEYLVHTYPFNGQFNFKTTTPAVPNNWTRWSAILENNEQGPHRILVMATDLAGNENWDERVVDILPPSSNVGEANRQQRIAFVEPTFTEGAYNKAFYRFYAKYTPTVQLGKNVTADLDLLNASIPKHLFRGQVPGFKVPRDDFREYSNVFATNVKKFAPNASLFNITDGDIDGGVLFDDKGRNMFDSLFLFHNEYVTQTEYTSLKKFVYNGGTLVAIDGNIFYAQVKYDKNNCTVALVKGHDWDFRDRKAAIKSDPEGYFDENKWFIGSNFIVNDIKDDVRFANNPFNYKHFEENYVNNPNALLLLDYGASFPEDRPQSNTSAGIQPSSHQKKIIATYEIEFGKGKVIMLGLFAERLANSTSFLNFFDNIVLTRALGSKYQLETNQTAANDIYWKSDYWNVSKIVAQPETITLVISLNETERKVMPLKTGNLTIAVPKDLIGQNSTSNSQGITVTANGTAIPFRQAADDLEIGLDISVPLQTKEIRIIAANNNKLPTA